MVDDSAATEPIAASPAAESNDEVEDSEEDAAPPAVAPTATDSGDDTRQVSHAEAAAYAQECGLLFFEASAKTGANVGEVFTEIGTSDEMGLKTPKC